MTSSDVAHLGETTMKKTVLAAVCAVAIGVTPFAAMAQDSKMGGGMQKSDGASQGMAKDSMKKDGMKKDSMHKDGMKKDNNMMMKKN
jgi:pentapeptide MXKDX repeat protein